MNVGLLRSMVYICVRACVCSACVTRATTFSNLVKKKKKIERMLELLVEGRIFIRYVSNIILNYRSSLTISIVKNFCSNRFFRNLLLCAFLKKKKKSIDLKQQTGGLTTTGSHTTFCF